MTMRKNKFISSSLDVISEGCTQRGEGKRGKEEKQEQFLHSARRDFFESFFVEKKPS